MQNYKFASFITLALVLKMCLTNILDEDYDIEERAQNVALLQTSSQSSLSDTLNPSSLAIDENRETCSRTGQEKDAVWSVDLGKKHPIAAILINTGQTFFGSSNEVLVGDNMTNSALCNYGPNHETNKDYAITCLNGPVMGRIVTIKNKFSGGLKLCDIRVMACDDGFYGNACSQTCHCNEKKTCNKLSGECPGLCAPGWNGDSCQTACQEGHFGPSCKWACHCRSDSNCSIVEGSCSNGCDESWVGQSCQTAIPKLKHAPSLKESQTTEITIKWPAWTSHLDDSISLCYLVEFKNCDDHSNATSTAWLPGTMVDHRGDAFIHATISNLKRNSFYEFRVVPILRLGDSEEEGEARGGASLESAPFKTKCNAPETANITSLHSWSGDRHASVAIHWTLLSKAQSNCDDIQYYEILYQKVGESTWKTEYSVHTVSSKNITGLNFDSDYWFIVVAHNNQPLDSSSTRKSFTTVADVQALQSTEQTTTDIGMLVGVAVCSVLVVALVVILLFYRKQLKKYNSIPQQDIEGKVQVDGAIRSISDNYHNYPPGGNYNPSASTNDYEDTNFNYGDEVTFSHDPPFLQPKHFLYENGRLGGKLREIPAPIVPSERHPIAIKDLEDYVIQGKDNDCQLLRKEFKEIPDTNVEASSTSGVRAENRYKNRFINILPYDHSRVVLDKSGDTEGSDYVNASYIDGYKKPRAYIASQGCNKWTVQDMWRMVWQIDTKRIVMVTNLIEKGKVKCEQYWNDKEQEETFYGNLCVTLVDVERTTDYIIRTFSIRLKQADEAKSDGENQKSQQDASSFEKDSDYKENSSKDTTSRIIKQFHYVAWPDHGVPDRAGPIIAFRRKVRLHDLSHPGVILVHCSAGVGRTGAFIALDYLLDQARCEGLLDVFEYVCLMRRDRVNMIQTLDQYVFVYKAILEALTIGDTIVASANFAIEFDEMIQPDQDGRTKLEQEYQLLESVSYKDKHEDHTLGDIPENKEKNRFPDILPADKHRPYLMTRVQGTNDYINAVYLDGYRTKNAYISTQMPMTHTVIDLWRLVHELQCGTVVMLNPWDEHDDTYGQYWSEENEECECGPFMIEATSVNRDNPDITVRELKLTFTPPPVQSSPTPKNNNNNNDKTDDSKQPLQQQQQLNVNHFQLNVAWPDSFKSNTMPTTSLKVALLSLLDMVEKSQMKTGNKPIVVHCRDGFTHSGLFAAVSCIIERLKDEQEVEVFQSVRKLRDHRPAVVMDFDQYKFCYEMVLAYLTEFSIYSNFR